MASTSSNVAIRDKITMELLKILAKINYAMVSKDLGHATVEFTRGFYAGLRELSGSVHDGEQFGGSSSSRARGRLAPTALSLRWPCA
ncbi:hypothetical protein PG996_003446 [Apiospora saccharicola]|uniref:Uncharacterized protein n=1 Tax=Apiospora saccharicola TaxID=335842 RepID=A0ABR1W1B6_9PEZI